MKFYSSKKVKVFSILFVIFSVSFAYFLIKKEQKQKQLIQALEKDDIYCEVVYPEWSYKLPEWAYKMLGHKITLDINVNDMVYFTENGIVINQKSIDILGELRNVHKISFYSNDYDIPDTLEYEVQLKFLKSVSNYSSLTELNLYCEKFTEKHLEYIEQISSLESLNLTSSEVPENVILSLSPLVNLETLKIDSNSRFMEDDLQHLKKLEKLKVLLLGEDHTQRDSNFRGYFCFHKIANFLPPMKNLEYLGTSMDLSTFDFSKYPSLIWFTSSNIVADKVILKKLAEHFGDKSTVIHGFLEKNGAYNCYLEVTIDVENEDLKYLNKLPFLRSIKFQNADLDFRKINWSEFKELHTVEFPLGVSLTKVMPYLKKLKMLHYLKGSGRDFTFENFTELRRYNTGLNFLDLIDNREDEKKYDDLGILFETDFLGNEFFTVEDILTYSETDIPVVNLIVDEITPEMVKALAKFKAIKELQIFCNRGLENLNFFKEKNTLEKLSIEFYKLPNTPLSGFDKLESLTLRYFHQSGALTQLISSAGFPELKRLTVESYSEKKIEINGLEPFAKLEHLQLSHTAFYCGEIQKMEGLKSLYIAGTCNVENLDFGISLESFETTDLEITNAKQFHSLIEKSEIIETLNLANVLDPQNIDIKDLYKFKNLRSLSFPPKAISKEEACKLVTKLTMLEILAIKNTGLWVDDFSQFIDLSVDYY